MARLKSQRTTKAKGAATLGASLVRRTGILSTLLLDQIESDLEIGAPDAFTLWLCFVLTPEEYARFGDWSPANKAGRQAMEKRYQTARDDDDLEGLLGDVKAAISGAANHGAGENQ